MQRGGGALISIFLNVTSERGCNSAQLLIRTWIQWPTPESSMSLLPPGPWDSETRRLPDGASRLRRIDFVVSEFLVGGAFRRRFRNTHCGAADHVLGSGRRIPMQDVHKFRNGAVSCHHGCDRLLGPPRNGIGLVVTMDSTKRQCMGSVQQKKAKPQFKHTQVGYRILQ